MSNTRYSEQFKRDAVRLVTEDGYSNKAANILANLPASMQEESKSRPHGIWQAETRASA